MKIEKCSHIAGTIAFVFALTVCGHTQVICLDSSIHYAAQSYPLSIVAADLDEDGDQDLAVSNFESESVTILRNDGDGTFSDSMSIAVGERPVSVVACDVDMDTDQDLIVAIRADYEVAVFKNTGNATYGAGVRYDSGPFPLFMTASDLDGDWDPDLVVANGAGGCVSILRNQGDGTYSSPAKYAVGELPLSIFAGHLDSNGSVDLAVVNYDYSGGTLDILLNDGHAEFASAVEYEAGNGSYTVDGADFDEDNDIDLVVGNLNSGVVSVFSNAGDGTFAQAVDYPAGVGSYSLTACDLDNDGHTDVASTGWTGSLYVLRNSLGEGTFSDPIQYDIGGAAQSIVAADLDGDGDSDLATAVPVAYDAGFFSVLTNCGDPPMPAMELDLSPNSCPNIINTGIVDFNYQGIRPGAAAANRPTVRVAILGTKAFDVSRVDPSTFQIAELSPLSHRLMDVSRPVKPRETECECTTAGADGYTDLVLYFDQAQFMAALAPVNDGEVRTLAFTGKTKTGVPLSGSDCVTFTEGPTRIWPLASAGEKTEAEFAAYPNPFNAATVVSFSLAAESDVHLDVYDVLGRRVATLVDDVMPAGEHQVSWDAAGSVSGVYFARLSTSAGMMTRKMVLVR